MSVSPVPISDIGGGGDDNGSSGYPRPSTKKVRRVFPEPVSTYRAQSEESEEDSSHGHFGPILHVKPVRATVPITIYSANDRISNGLNKSRSAGPCSPNNSSSESSTYSTATTEIPRCAQRKSLQPTTPTAIPIRKGGFTFVGYRSQSAFSLLQTQAAHSGHQPKTRLGMPCPAKKQNKWDAVMSKIAETKNKAINIRDVKSRVYSSVKMSSAGPAPLRLDPNAIANRKLCNIGNSAKSRHRHLLLHEVDHFSSQSSTLSVSDSSSLDEHHLRGATTRVSPPRVLPQPRVKKDSAPVKSRRQMSDLSSASDYSTTAQSQGVDHEPPPRRKPRSTVPRVTAAQSHSSLVTAPIVNVAVEKQGNVGSKHPVNNKAKRYSSSTSVGAFPSARAPLSTARNVVPTTNGTGNSKSHPHKPLRDRNRMAPSGKASAMDTTNTNGAAARTNGHPEALTNLISEDDNTGDVTIIPTKPATSRIDSSIQVCLDSVFGNGRFIEEMAMSEDSEDASAQINYVNSRRNNQHHQSQNAVILENTTLKEEINQMRLLIQELQGQVKLFSSNYEKQKRQMASQNSDLAATNSRFLSMTLVAQYFDLQHTLIAGRLATVEDRCLMKETEKVEDTKKELCSKFQEDRNSHKEQIASLTKNYESEISELEEYYEGRISRAKENNDVIIADLRRIHEEDMQRLEANYRAEIDIIKLKHEEQLADQVKRAPGDILHKEIHSLQVVVEIRNQEIRDLRHDLLEAQSKIEALSQTNDQNKGLSARVEDLEAQLEKTRRDKNKIMEKFNTMETSMSQVVTENDRLHLYTEELNWRIETLKADDHVGQSMSKSAIEFGTSFSAD